MAVLPATDARHAAWAMLWATTHWKRLVNGAFVFVPPTVQTLADQEETVDSRALAHTLRSIYPLRYALVDRSALSAAEAAAWTRIDHDPRDGITFVGRFGRDDVFRVEGTPQEAPVVRRWFSADYVRRHPRAEYALGLTGADPDTRRRVEVRFNERLLATHDGPGRGTRRTSRRRTGRETGTSSRSRTATTWTRPRRASPPTAIGRTGTQAPVDIEATSATGPSARASLRINGLEQLDRNGRGYVIAVLDPRDGAGSRASAGSTRFATRRSRAAWRATSKASPAGAIVVALVRDEGTANLSPDAVRALAVDRRAGGRERTLPRGARRHRREGRRAWRRRRAGGIRAGPGRRRPRAAPRPGPRSLRPPLSTARAAARRQGSCRRAVPADASAPRAPGLAQRPRCTRAPSPRVAPAAWSSDPSHRAATVWSRPVANDDEAGGATGVSRRRTPGRADRGRGPS